MWKVVQIRDLLSTLLECTTSPNCSASCPPGTIGVCKGPKANCSVTCAPLACDACNPNCAPVCALGSSPPCVNSRCALASGVTSTTSANLVSNCVWTPSLNSNGCISQQIQTCPGKPPCASSSCLTYSNGTSYWDTSTCQQDCSSVPQSLCPGGYTNCTAGPGICLLSGTSCLWTCPIDPCVNSSTGGTNCPSPEPQDAPFPGCASWNTRCLVTDANVSPAICSWDVKCTQVVPYSGPCNASVDCGMKPNTLCPGKENWSCTRPGSGGPCQWLYVCPPDPTLTAPCSDADCANVNTVDSSTSICGVNPQAKPVCIRNSVGICQKLTPCCNVYSPPLCQVSPCGDTCYDPRWLTNEVTPPDSFDDPGNFSTNCSLCVMRCATLLTCNRPTSNPICQFSPNNYYDTCIAKCNNSYNNATAPSNSSSGPYIGQNPCLCDYTVSVFVTAIYPSGVMVATCISIDSASVYANNLPGVQNVYSSSTLPTSCQVIGSNSSSSTIINKVSNLKPEDLQQDILDKLVDEDDEELLNYLPQLSAVLVPSSSQNRSALTAQFFATDHNPLHHEYGCPR